MSFFPTDGGGLFKQGAFTIDQNSTPEMLAKKRELIASMMPQYGKAKYVGEGIGQLFTGIASGRKTRAMDKFEGEKRQEAAGQFNSIMSGGAPMPTGPMSILGMRQPQGGYRESLIGTESGGNFGAQNNEVGAGGKRGHFGRVQFGQARLQDAMNAGAIPQGTTPQQFMGSPDLQMAAEDWHFADLEKNLAPYVGAVVNGEPLDMGALVAMGHLGGAGGARKYVESGGQYNPSDSFGTSLSDYAQKHGGNSFQPGPGTQVAQNGPQLNDLMMAAQNPWLSPQQKQVINSQIQQMQGQQQAMQQRQWGREDAAYDRQQEQQDPMYQAKLAQAQLDLDQDRSGTGGDGLPAAVQEAQWRAVQAGLTPGTPEYQSFILNDGGDPSTFRSLDMQAQAAGFKPGNPDYAQFMATRGAGLQAGAKTTAENLADVATGGAAEGAKDLGKATVSAGISAWEGYGNMQASIATISDAIEAIDSGAESGVVAKYLPDVTEASASLNNAMNRMGLDVIGSVTFGALSEGEMRLAMNTAAPRDLSPEALRSWLVKKQAAQQKTAAMLANAAQYLTKPGNTLNGWIEQNRAAGNPAPQQSQSGAVAPTAAPDSNFEAFAATPSAIAAAEKYGVTLEEMWAIKQGQN